MGMNVPDDVAGFVLIKDMQREELVNELLSAQRHVFENATDDQLRMWVVQARLTDVKHRLIAESGIAEIEPWSPW